MAEVRGISINADFRHSPTSSDVAVMLDLVRFEWTTFDHGPLEEVDMVQMERQVDRLKKVTDAWYATLAVDE